MSSVEPQISQLLAAFLGRLRAIKDAQPTMLFYHGDPDGLCAAATAQALVERIKPNSRVSSCWIGTHQFDFSLIAEHLNHHSGENIFFFDLNLSSRSGFLAQIASHDRNTLTVVDDHLINDEELDLSRVLLNPNVGSNKKRPIDCPASLFAYLAALSINTEVPAWVPAIGLFADRQLRQNRHLLRGDVPTEGELFEIAAVLSNPFLDPQISNSDSFVLEYLVAAIRQKQTWEAFRQEALSDTTLKSPMVRVNAALEREASGLIEKGPEHRLSGRRPVVVFRQQSAFRFTNILASRIRPSFPESVVFVYRVESDIAFFEIRLGDQLFDCDIVRVLRGVAKTIEFRNYGGHARAAGGACAANVFEVMVRRYAELSNEGH